MTLNRLSNVTYALVRIVFGILWLLHGLQKFGVPEGQAVAVASLMGVAGIIEVTLGTLIAIGLFTRPAAFVASGQMAVAYFMTHLPRSFFPIANGGEQALLFCFVFLFIATQGPGIFSLDSKR